VSAEDICSMAASSGLLPLPRRRRSRAGVNCSPTTVSNRPSSAFATLVGGAPILHRGANCRRRTRRPSMREPAIAANGNEGQATSDFLFVYQLPPRPQVVATGRLIDVLHRSAAIGSSLERTMIVRMIAVAVGQDRLRPGPLHAIIPSGTRCATDQLLPCPPR